MRYSGSDKGVIPAEKTRPTALPCASSGHPWLPKPTGMLISVLSNTYCKNPFHPRTLFSFLIFPCRDQRPEPT